MTIDEMDKFTLLRWNALIEGVNMIYDQAEKCNMDIDILNVKRNHLVRYIDEVTEKVRVI